MLIALVAVIAVVTALAWARSHAPTDLSPGSLVNCGQREASGRDW
jgi:hypothetical protein